MRYFQSLFFALVLVGLFSCKRDLTGPQITIQGPNPLKHYLGRTYRDPGAIAIDPETGDVSGTIKVTSNVNPNALGEYLVSYSARDKYRNKSTNNPSRKVLVILNAESLVGYYQFNQQNFGGDNITNFDFITYKSDTSFSFFNFSNLDSIYINAYLSGDFKDRVLIPKQLVLHKGNSYEVSGSGKVAGDGQSLEIDFEQIQINSATPTVLSGKVSYKRFNF